MTQCIVRPRFLLLLTKKGQLAWPTASYKWSLAVRILLSFCIMASKTVVMIPREVGSCCILCTAII